MQALRGIRRCVREPGVKAIRVLPWLQQLRKGKVRAHDLSDA
jgi:hypothetical protein